MLPVYERGDAMSFYSDVIKKDSRFVSPVRVADTAMLLPEMRNRVQALLREAADEGHPLIVFETFRSMARQTALYNQGASHLKLVGVHNYGLACDLVKNADGEPSWKGDFGFLCALAHKHGLIWGGDWGRPDIKHGFVDPVHVQMIKVPDQNKLFSGTWYPDEAYNPYA